MRKKNNDTLEIIIFIFIFGLVSFGLIHAGFYLCNKYSPHAKYLLSDEYIDTKYSAEHGGGNNSSFTTHVVTSSGTDT